MAVDLWTNLDLLPLFPAIEEPTDATPAFDIDLFALVLPPVMPPSIAPAVLHMPADPEVLPLEQQIPASGPVIVDDTAAILFTTPAQPQPITFTFHNDNVNQPAQPVPAPAPAPAPTSKRTHDEASGSSASSKRSKAMSAAERRAAGLCTVKCCQRPPVANGRRCQFHREQVAKCKRNERSRRNSDE